MRSRFADRFFLFESKTELLRPWKLCSFAAGLLILIIGAYYYDFIDWDVGISVLMAGFTYLTAPVVMRKLLSRSFEAFPGILFWTWFTVDGVYTLYHLLMGNEMIRLENARCSLPLYLFMGGIWLFKGTLRELRDETLLRLRKNS